MNRTTRILASSFVAMFANAASAGEAGTMRVVLKGYDPVAYFTDGKPVKGDPEISYDWDEGRYYFASGKHRDMFASEPERYAPQFAGYCTGSMARGVRNEGNPEAWTIADGKLYVFGAPDSRTAAMYKAVAESDPDGFRVKAAKARSNWPGR